MKNLYDIRTELAHKLKNRDFVIDKSGVKTIELISESFIANNPIFREPNRDYINREIEWYKSQSLYVKDIPGKTPVIWEQVSSEDGKINSNYGYLIYSDENGNQYENVKSELISNPYSRRAIMIYNRPSMHTEYNTNGMSDFICTNSVQYLVRDNKLHAVVNMRSNDVVFGYLNDQAWQKYVLDNLSTELNIKPGYLYWNAGSLHVYEKDFYLVDYFSKTGIHTISKSRYIETFPKSEYCK